VSAKPEIEIRALTTHREFAEAVAIQREIWGFADLELLPVRLFVVAGKVGGQVFGAYHGARLVAFLLAIPGLKSAGRFYLHSHMLGVLKEYNDLGIGRLLKLRQREDAVARGIELVEWTFDPLELKNAFFNLERLGAVIRRYVENQYGASSSFLHGGLPTDRCTAEWWVSSERVKAVLENRSCARPPVIERIAVPTSIGRLKTEDPKEAARIHEHVRQSFLAAFRRGLVVVGFERSAEHGTYLLAEDGDYI
jgi:predicted GNAT superfamily acetyltransferase